MEKKINVIIEKLIPGGKGLCRVNGKVVFVPFVLPGENVEIEIIEEKKNFSEARLIGIIEKSPLRIEPVCPYYYSCGGCNMMHMDYRAQLKFKEDFAENLLERNGKINNLDVQIIPSKPLHYRNRIQVHLDKEKMGFRERSSHRIIPISHCSIAVKGLNDFLSSDEKYFDKDRLVVFGDEDWYSKESSDKEIHITLNGKKIYFKSSLFFQSNLSILPELSMYLNRFVTGDVLYDLFCGVGLLSSMVENKFKKIYAVEINKKVEPFIHKNLKSEFRFYPESLEKWINSGRKEPADTIIIDPPRTGLSKEVRKFLNLSNAEIILYVSCDPATMSRDLKDIIADKYIIEDFKLFDFYPQTSHMEAVAVLKRLS